jgi:hypothetical protein
LFPTSLIIEFTKADYPGPSRIDTKYATLKHYTSHKLCTK